MCATISAIRNALALASRLFARGPRNSTIRFRPFRSPPCSRTPRYRWPDEITRTRLRIPTLEKGKSRWLDFVLTGPRAGATTHMLPTASTVHPSVSHRRDSGLARGSLECSHAPTISTRLHLTHRTDPENYLLPAPPVRRRN